jgi:hypothetical protein
MTEAGPYAAARPLSERIMTGLLDYGPIPAKMATAIAAQPVTAGLAAGEAAADPSIPNLTNAGVQTALMAFRPAAALGALGLGYGAALAKDTGAFGLLGSANASGDGLSDAQRKRVNHLQRKRSLSRAEREELNGYVSIQRDFAAANAKADAEARAKERTLAAESEAAKKASERAEFDRAVGTAERARDTEMSRSRRFSDTEVGKVWDKTGGFAPALIGAGLGGLSRAATGGGSNLYNYGLPAALGGIGGAAASNLPLAYNAFLTEPDNPERRAYEAYARELPPNHPRKQEWADYARTLPEANPVRATAAAELYDPVKAAERVTYGAIEGVGGGLAGADLMRMPGRIVDTAANLPGRALSGYRTGMQNARGISQPGQELRKASSDALQGLDRSRLGIAEAQRKIDDLMGAQGSPSSAVAGTPRQPPQPGPSQNQSSTSVVPSQSAASIANAGAPGNLGLMTPATQPLALDTPPEVVEMVQRAARGGGAPNRVNWQNTWSDPARAVMRERAAAGETIRGGAGGISGKALQTEISKRLPAGVKPPSEAMINQRRARLVQELGPNPTEKQLRALFKKHPELWAVPAAGVGMGLLGDDPYGN